MELGLEFGLGLAPHQPNRKPAAKASPQPVASTGLAAGDVGWNHMASALAAIAPAGGEKG